MIDTEARSSLPPGKTGLPFLGETIPFLKDGFGFVERRVAQYGPIFRMRMLGRETAVIAGPDASAEFINTQHVIREGAMLPHIQELFGGHALPTLDGPGHLERKRFVLAGFTRDALAAYVPLIQQRIRTTAKRWASSGEIRWLDEFKRLALEVICETIMGLPPGAKVDQLRRDYDLIGGGFASLPIPLPGTAYTQAKKALQRILAVFEENIRAHQSAPRDDGLSRILAAKSQTSGRAITTEEAKIELHHIIVAGLIVWAWFSTAVLELDKHAEIRRRLLEEARNQLPDGPLTLEKLQPLQFLNQFTMEVRRLSPVIPVFFGKARETFQFKGHTVPAGWMVLWGHRSSHLREEIYKDPTRFDPDRFSAERAEDRKHEYAFVPNGAGPATGHKCAGVDFSTLMLKVFSVELVRLDWQLSKPQNLSYNWAVLPPEPRDGLRVKVQRS